MFAVIPLFISTFSAIILSIIRRSQPKFTQYWLLSLLVALVIWVLTLTSRIQAVVNIPIFSWQPYELFPISPAMQMDNISWLYSFSLATLLFAAILTDSVSMHAAADSAAHWMDWAKLMVAFALSMLASMSGNLLFLMFAWFALDTFLFITWIASDLDEAGVKQAVSNYAYHIASLFLVLIAWMITSISTGTYKLNELPPGASLFLLLAAGLRLLIPPHLCDLPGHPNLSPSYGGVLMLMTASTSLVVLTRIAEVGVPELFTFPLLLIALLAGLLSSWQWYYSQNELRDAHFWIRGTSALVMAATIRIQPQASLSWGIVVLLSGGMLLLYSVRRRWLLLFLLLALIFATTLPYTPSWSGVLLYAGNPGLLIYAFMVVQGLLIAGYFIHATRPGDRFPSIERWAWVFYPAGLIVLLLAYLLCSFFGHPEPGFSYLGQPTLRESWPGLTVVVMSIMFVYLRRTGIHLPFKIPDQLSGLFSTKWIRLLLHGLNLFTQRTIASTNYILEGRGGLLWTLLLLTLLISLLAGINPGR